jgi:hypothetical protein
LPNHFEILANKSFKIANEQQFNKYSALEKEKGWNNFSLFHPQMQITSKYVLTRNLLLISF